jgi:hypothetical protein
MWRSLRRRVRRPKPQGPYFQKEFFHNGYIKSLKQLVHFYNTRDAYQMSVESGECPTGTTERVNCWHAAEVPQNHDMTIGMLNLTDQEENQIVKFLETLNDGYTTPFPDINTYTGVCIGVASMRFRLPFATTGIATLSFEGLRMNRLHVKLAIAAAAATLLFSNPTPLR